MYCNHFGFSQKPFDVTPDPRFLYLTEGHREALGSIIYGIRERRGFIAIIGEMGTGKTTLLNAALDRFDEKTKVAFIFNSDVTFDQLLNMALYEWGLTKEKEELSKPNAIKRLNRFAVEQSSKGGNVVLIVDEAQNLDNRVMENLRLLSNLETPRQKLIQIVLSGQPEIDSILNGHDLRQLAQRISLKRYVYPLDEKGTYSYLQHRLKVAQNSGKFPFTPEAQKLIWEYTNGVPRKINILCDNSFLIGYALKMKKINATVVQEAVQDSKWLPLSDSKTSSGGSPADPTGLAMFETKPPRHLLKSIAAIIVAGIIIVIGGLFLNARGFQFASLRGFFSNQKETGVETIPQAPMKQKEQISLSVSPAPADILQKIDIQQPEKNIETETVANKDELSSLTAYRGNLLEENDQSKIPTSDEEKTTQTVSIKEEVIIRQVVVKKGENLFRIILNTYGAYDDMILNKVRKQNPDIIDLNSIIAGQTIKLPVDKD